MSGFPLKNKDTPIDEALEREIFRLRSKIARRIEEDRQTDSPCQQPRSASTPPIGFVGFLERSFHEDEGCRGKIRNSRPSEVFGSKLYLQMSMRSRKELLEFYPGSISSRFCPSCSSSPMPCFRS